MKKLAIIGSGDLGAQIAHHAVNNKTYQVVGFFDDYAEKGSTKHGYPVLGVLDDVEASFLAGNFDCLMIGIGYKHLVKKGEIYNRFKDIIPFGSVIDSSCVVDPTAQIGEGSILYPGCIIDKHARILPNSLLNLGCIISHDSEIGSHSFLSPACKIAGFVKVGSCVNLGIGTIVIDNLHIADYVRTGGGAVVTKNLDQPGLYVGVPAVFKKP
jgi:sugar O-acyltransferase (sialic acid O-acetyltransferase NeuD family)